MDGKGTFTFMISVRARKLIWPAAKVRFAAASSSQGVLRSGRLTTTPATMARPPLRSNRPPDATRRAGRVPPPPARGADPPVEAKPPPRRYPQAGPHVVRRDEQGQPDEITRQ